MQVAVSNWPVRVNPLHSGAALFGLLALRDVFNHPNKPGRLALRASQQRDGRQTPHQYAVFTVIAFFNHILFEFTRQQAPQ